MSTAPRIGNAQQALNKLRQIELDSRRRAKTILQPVEVANGLSAARLLTTTLGGQVRRITPADLAAFGASVAQLGSKARQGITAAEALSLSRPDDLKRAREEIRYSLVSSLQAGKVQLVTNSGPRSDVTRHFVNVEFVQFPAALTWPGTPMAAATWLVRESALKFECGCKHFRFFLRFVATAGGWVAGRAEHGFPKLKNPTLDGACCKHLARALTDVAQSGGLRGRIAKMIESERARIDRPGKAKGPIIRFSQAEAESLLPKRARRIPVVQPEQRTGLPAPASTGDLQKALARFEKRKDASSQAIARGLKALIEAQRAAP